MGLGKGVLTTAQIGLSAGSDLCWKHRVAELMCFFLFNCYVKHWSVPTITIEVPENNMQDIFCSQRKACRLRGKIK